MPDIVATPHEDRVVIAAGDTAVPIPYATAFRVAQGLRVAAKRALRMTGAPADTWRDHAVPTREVAVPKPARAPRRVMTGRVDWRVGLRDRDERVFLSFGNVALALHFAAALRLSAEIEATARAAKAWAGDRGRSGPRAMGLLTDAERDYKHGWT